LASWADHSLFLNFPPPGSNQAGDAFWDSLRRMAPAASWDAPAIRKLHVECARELLRLLPALARSAEEAGLDSSPLLWAQSILEGLPHPTISNLPDSTLEPAGELDWERWQAALAKADAVCLRLRLRLGLGATVPLQIDDRRRKRLLRLAHLKEQHEEFNARIEEARGEPEASAPPGVRVDRAAGQVLVNGAPYPAEPWELSIVQALLDADGDYVTGPDLQNLAGCHGKKIWLVVKGLKARIPALDGCLAGQRRNGFRLIKSENRPSTVPNPPLTE